MELVEGTTLREQLASGPLPIKKLLQIAPQVAEGLARAHEAGIVHRDLKPENVMVKKDGLRQDPGLRPGEALLDGLGQRRGLAAADDDGDAAGRGRRDRELHVARAGERADGGLSLGPVLARLDALRDGDGQAGVPEEDGDRHARGDPERRAAGAIATLNPQTPAPLRWIVERCLAKEPRERYASTEDLARELASVRDHLSELSSGHRGRVR